MLTLISKETWKVVRHSFGKQLDVTVHTRRSLIVELSTIGGQARLNTRTN